MLYFLVEYTKGGEIRPCWDNSALQLQHTINGLQAMLQQFGDEEVCFFLAGNRQQDLATLVEVGLEQDFLHGFVSNVMETKLNAGATDKHKI